MKDNSKDVSDSGNLVELSENLFDKSSSNIMRDFIITEYGIRSFSGSSVSDFIPVIKGKRYTTMYVVDEWNVLENGDYDLVNLVKYSRNYVAYYDDDKALIGITNSEPYQAPLIPDRCKYIRVAYETAKENAKYAFSSVKKDGVEVVWFGWGEHNLTTEEVDYLIANNITYENGTYDTASAMIKWLNTAENKYCSGIESGRIPANIALSKKAYLLN